MQPAPDQQPDAGADAADAAQPGQSGRIKVIDVAAKFSPPEPFFHNNICPRGARVFSSEGRISGKANAADVDDADRLMERIRRRDAVAFESMYDAYHRLVFGIAFRMLGDRAAAEDCTQAVFLKVWSSPDGFKSGNFAAWIARVARNRALDMLRSRAAHPQSELPVDIPVDIPLDEAVFANVNAAAVRRALGELPDEQRTLIERGFFGGLTHEELAVQTGVPLGTVKTRIRNGLRKLRAALEGRVNAQ